MYERRNLARRTGSRAMRELLMVLNADFKKGYALPDVKDEADRVEAEYLQASVVSRLAPILGFVPPVPVVSPPDPGHIARMQGAIAQYREAEDARIRRKQKTVECPICHRRRTIPVGTRVRCSHGSAKEYSEPSLHPRTCEDALRELALELSEWAENAPIYPRWQVNDNQLPTVSETPAERRYQGGEKVLTVSQILPCPPTLKNSTMLNLGVCLVSGELNRLRVCAYGECERYFYAGHFRKTHCSEICQLRHDRARAPGRARRWREEQHEQHATLEAALKGYARAMLQKLSLRMVRGLRKQRVLNYNEGEVLDGLREQFATGIPFEQIWRQRRALALFKKLRMAGVV